MGSKVVIELLSESVKFVRFIRFITFVRRETDARVIFMRDKPDERDKRLTLVESVVDKRLLFLCYNLHCRELCT